MLFIVAFFTLGIRIRRQIFVFGASFTCSYMLRIGICERFIHTTPVCGSQRACKNCRKSVTVSPSFLCRIIIGANMLSQAVTRNLQLVELNCRIAVAFKSKHFVIFEGALVPFLIFYSRVFSVGLMTAWGIVLASFGSRCLDVILVLVVVVLSIFHS